MYINGKLTFPVHNCFMTERTNYPPIIDLIINARNNDETGAGGEITLYPAGEELPDILIAFSNIEILGKGKFELSLHPLSVSELLKSTCLSTPAMILPHYIGLKPSTAGLPLAQIYHPEYPHFPPLVQFIPKIKGRDLTQWDKENPVTMEDLLKLPDSVWGDFLYQVKAITEAGLYMDFSAGNLMLRDDNTQLCIIDVAPPQKGEKLTISIEDFFDEVIYQDSEKKLELFNKILDAAAAIEIIVPRKIQALNAALEERFVKNDSTTPEELTRFGTLPLTASPDDLRSYLAAIHGADCGIRTTRG